MSDIAQCPVCSTCFRVSQDQLDARAGWVRCGQCQAVFNATEHMRDDQPSPQLELHMAPKAIQEVPAENVNELAPELPEETSKESQDLPPDAAIAEASPAGAEAAVDKQPEESAPVTLAQQITMADGIFEHRPPQIRKERKWPWVVASMLLLIVMLAQAAYFLRVEISARMPGLKPALQSYCNLLNCSIPLPRKIDLVSIDSSDLEADPVHANLITLHAILRNNAPFAQAYPDLEVSFTDTQDKLLARRTLRPVEYLRADENEQQGILPRREASIRLHLDTSDLKPTGYRLFLYYSSPQ